MEMALSMTMVLIYEAIFDESSSCSFLDDDNSNNLFLEQVLPTTMVEAVVAVHPPRSLMASTTLTS